MKDEPNASQAGSRAWGEALRALKWQFYREVEPHRPALFGYCRRLCGDVFLAEDLHQETLLRAFAKLSERFEPLRNPRAYLFRIATNLWIDQQKKKRETPMAEPPEVVVQPAPLSPREIEDGLALLIDKLPPRELAAFLLFQVFEFSQAETAGVVGTTPAAVKMAASRARHRLRKAVPAAAEQHAEAKPLPAPQVSPALLQRFAIAFQQRDIAALSSLLHEHANAKVAGCAEEQGRDEILRGTLHYASQVGKHVRVTVESLDGRLLLAHWYLCEDGHECVADLTLVSAAAGLATAMHFYYFSPQVLAEVCGRLGLPYRSNGYAVFEKGWWNE